MPGRGDELREALVIEKDDGVTGVETEEVDVPNERARDVFRRAHPRSFATGVYSILCACATGSQVT